MYSLVVLALAACVYNAEAQRFLSSYRPTGNAPSPPVAPQPLPVSVQPPNLPVSLQPPNLPPVAEPAPLGSDLMYAPSAKSFACPEKHGRWPLQGQCDAYVECVNGEPSEEWCPDGLLFNPKADKLAYPCVYKTEVDCVNREKLQTANSTADCPHQYGYFRMGGPTSCGQFHNCVAGKAVVVNCPEGLAFNSETYRCDWPDQVRDCDSEAYLGFKCPPAPMTRTLEGELVDVGFRFFRNELNCQHYFLCMETGVRLLGCDHFQAFDEYTNKCEDIETVPECPLELRQTRSAERYH